ncbi:hypothetical protein M434DRAFT_14144 [Hypoxylon sp. CO27-5]|nr:hypothetical protein M434DRAFT_14144 [Hypoxylon sp. CO27-5]
MSFGYAIGDVVAVIGLFERVSIELRNYKNAPAHFQQLSAELDLLRRTLQQVLCLCPENEAECQTLEQIRTIAIHCLQPLQTLADKMQAKESSLGHFRTTGSLSNIGTRLHWSMIAQKDIDEFRKTILSEMAAINILLSSQQLSCIKRMFNEARERDIQVSRQIDIRSDTLMRQTSLILAIVSATPDAISDLRSTMTAQAKQQSQQVEAQSQDLATITSQLQAVSSDVSATSKATRDLSTCTKEMIEAISRNTKALFDITRQMKRIAKAIEAIPLHLSVDIIRLDDALGEIWGLPFQACSTWSSFESLLRNVVFANGRIGANRVETNQYVILSSRTGQRIDPWNWHTSIKSGMHIEQSMVLNDINSTGKKRLVIGSTGSAKEDIEETTCNDCSRCQSFMTLEKPCRTTLDRLTTWGEDASKQQTQIPPDVPTTARQPLFPPIQISEDHRYFRRIHVYVPEERINDIHEAMTRLDIDKRDSAANHCAGRYFLQLTEDHPDNQRLRNPIPYLEAAITADHLDSETWYLLGRACLAFGSFPRAYKTIQQAIYRNRTSAAYWITLGRLFYKIGQYQEAIDALSRAILINPSIWQSWVNLGISYDAVGKYTDAMDSYQRCLELNPDLPDVGARQEVLRNHDLQNVPGDHRIYHMRDIPLRIIEGRLDGDERDIISMALGLDRPRWERQTDGLGELGHAVEDYMMDLVT